MWHSALQGRDDDSVQVPEAEILEAVPLLYVRAYEISAKTVELM